jgi:hypothetical protein
MADCHASNRQMKARAANFNASSSSSSSSSARAGAKFQHFDPELKKESHPKSEPEVYFLLFVC